MTDPIFSEMMTTLLFQVTIGGIGGFLIGYTFKKMAKVTLIIGVFVFTLILLAYTNVINVDYSVLIDMSSAIAETVNPALHLITPLLANIPFAISLFFGLLIGVRRAN
jgi:uncharacterized membrane protein (Fun14 family)